MNARRQGWWLPMMVFASCVGGADATDRVILFAAASLTEAVDDVVAEFERQDSTDIVVSLAGSNQLALQIVQGAPADVFISANPDWMEYLVARELVDPPTAIARNRIAVATPQSNPAGLASWTDLARPGTLVVTAAVEVPAGRYADAVLTQLGLRHDAPSAYAAVVQANVVSREESVKGVVAKLLLGEADAGLVYRTDVTTSNKLMLLPLPAEIGHTDNYLMARTARSTNAAARRFVAFVRSDAAQRILIRWGFEPPTGDPQ